MNRARKLVERMQKSGLFEQDMGYTKYKVTKIIDQKMCGTLGIDTGMIFHIGTGDPDVGIFAKGTDKEQAVKGISDKLTFDFEIIQADPIQVATKPYTEV